jgi:hypothetical protein
MEATAFRNGSDPMPEKLISDLDRTHVVHFSGIYELPFGPGKPLLASTNRIIKSLVGGWQAAASWQRHTGAPLGFANSILLASLQDVPLHADKAIGRWFNTNAFNRLPAEQLASNLIGLSSRFSGIRGPVADVWNMSGVKKFILPERMRLEFRAEFLNALNYTNLSAPNTNPVNAAFGSITSAQGNQRSIVFGLKLSY